MRWFLSELDGRRFNSGGAVELVAYGVAVSAATGRPIAANALFAVTTLFESYLLSSQRQRSNVFPAQRQPRSPRGESNS
jgi:hypothetical protein